MFSHGCIDKNDKTYGLLKLIELSRDKKDKRCSRADVLNTGDPVKRKVHQVLVATFHV